MMRPNDDADAAGFEMLLDRLRDLPRQSLLDLQPAREAVDQPRQLPDVVSRHALSTRAGVSRSPSRDGSSP